MKQYYRNWLASWVLMIMSPLLLLAQAKDSTRTSMLRIYEDNDFINIAGNSTDKAYTNGTKLDYFHSIEGRPGLFIDRLFPKAGSNSTTILSWGITELMFTPNDLHASTYQAGDYPYSTALFLTHGLYSYNAFKKISFHTELMAGIRGPAALGEQTQTFIHRLIHFQTPRGWDNQLNNKAILNISFTAEKQLIAYQNKVDIIGTASVEAGSLTNAATFSPVIRIGKMNPYFNGIINQYTNTVKQHQKKKKNVQAYLLFKPGVSFYASNGILQSNNQVFNEEGKTERLPAIKHVVWFLNGGAVLSINRVGISFNQNFTSALMQQLYAHVIGNVSVYYSL